jgi:hypothetical protein
MRIIGLILVLLGGLALGYQGFVHAGGRSGEAGAGPAARQREELSIPPVVSGIAVVSGLLLLASARRPCET